MVPCPVFGIFPEGSIRVCEDGALGFVCIRTMPCKAGWGVPDPDGHQHLASSSATTTLLRHLPQTQGQEHLLGSAWRGGAERGDPCGRHGRAGLQLRFLAACKLARRQRRFSAVATQNTSAFSPGGQKPDLCLMTVSVQFDRQIMPAGEFQELAWRQPAEVAK